MMSFSQKCLLILSMFLGLSYGAYPARAAERPQLGAQIWIEPGQTDKQIDGWFHQLAEAQMPVARLFMMWSYMEPRKGEWDFSLYDSAFRAAEKHHVAIVATLTPSGPPTFEGGDGNQGVGMVISDERKAEASNYIRKVVERYRTNPALDSWLLVNEPGESPEPDPLAIASYREWLPKQYKTIYDLNLAWGSNWPSFQRVSVASGSGSWNKNSSTDWMTFWRGYQTQELAWLASQVRTVDPSHPLHLNPHALVGNLAALSDDLPSWRPFLDTLGCSIHPAWHFGLLSRDRYALGVSYVNALVRGSIEPKPYWVTELQGGNNIYSSTRPMDPTPDDIAQWMWTSIASGADRVIFWLLNARRAGVEAGEWSLLDFQQQPSERLRTASYIAKILKENEAFFGAAKPVKSSVTLILSLETMTLEAQYADSDYAGRDKNAQILETLGFYEALSQIGIPPEIKHFGDYDWRGARSGRTVILPDVRAVTESQVVDLEAFVRNGNTLIISGLTGFYDPHALAWPLAGFPLGKVTGAEWKEVHFMGDKFEVQLTSPAAQLPSHLWFSTVVPKDSKAIGTLAGETIATRREVGKGVVIWLPTPLGLGGWLTQAGPLATYLQQILPVVPIRFAGAQKDCLMQGLVNYPSYLLMVTNGSSEKRSCQADYSKGFKAVSLWGPMPGGDGKTFELGPRQTSVLLISAREQ